VRGLGYEDQIHVVVSATALCINPGSNHPKAVNKESVAVCRASGVGANTPYVAAGAVKLGCGHSIAPAHRKGARGHAFITRCRRRRLRTLSRDVDPPTARWPPDQPEM
jgi:hypothetical protein